MMVRKGRIRDRRRQLFGGKHGVRRYCCFGPDEIRSTVSQRSLFLIIYVIEAAFPVVAFSSIELPMSH